MVVFIFLICGAFLEYPFEPDYLAGNHMALLNSPLSVFHNIALSPDDFKFTTCYANPFSIQDLHFTEMVLSYREMSFGVQAFGNEFYREITGALGVKKRIRKTVYGFSLRLATLRIKGESPINHPMIDFGLYLRLNKNADIGISLRDFIPLSTKKNISFSSVTFSLLMKAKSLRGYLDVKMEEGFSNSFILSGEMLINPLFILGSGICSNPPVIFAGFKIKRKISISYGYRYHMLLSGTHTLAINYGT